MAREIKKIPAWENMTNEEFKNRLKKWKKNKKKRKHHQIKGSYKQ